MSLGSFIKKQFIDILQWNEDVEGVLAWRYPMQDFEIQYGGSLTVRESQVAVFVNEGKIADVFGPGMYKLTTQTLPVLTYLRNWDKLFQSPFKSDVYFFSTRLQTGRKWGTPQAITLRDTDFGMVRLRAFGMYSYGIADARKFFTSISGTRAVYTRDDLEDQLRGIMVATMATSLGTASAPFLDMAANQTLMAEQVKGGIAGAFEKYGLALDVFNVTSINLPEDLQEALDRRIAMGMAGDLAKFTQFQVANAVPLAAQNEGGMAGVGASLSAGLVLGQTMAQGLTAAHQSPTAAPVPAPAAAPAAPEPEARLSQLKGLLDKGLISVSDFDSAKAEILKRLVG
jgi:membrane protease subunit (stomatin/prohibitin family)